MSSIEGYQARQDRVAENIELMRGLPKPIQRPRSGREQLHKTFGFSARKSCFNKRLAGGDTTGEAARYFRVTAARISQLRRELQAAWNELQGEQLPTVA